MGDAHVEQAEEDGGGLGPMRRRGGKAEDLSEGRVEHLVVQRREHALAMPRLPRHRPRSARHVELRVRDRDQQRIHH